MGADGRRAQVDSFADAVTRRSSQGQTARQHCSCSCGVAIPRAGISDALTSCAVTWVGRRQMQSCQVPDSALEWVRTPDRVLNDHIDKSLMGDMCRLGASAGRSCVLLRS